MPRPLLTILLLALLLLRIPSASASLPRHAIDGLDYIAVDDLATAVNGRVLVHGTKDKVELRFPGHVAVLTLFSAVLVVDNVAWRLPYPVEQRDADVFVHEDILDVLRRVAPGLLPDAEAPVSRREASSDPSPGGEPETAAAPESLEASEPRDFTVPIAGPDRDQLRSRWSVDTVIIDPGHGGKDPGAIGPGKTREKDITLQVAKRLRDLVEKELGIKAILTRDSDTFVSLGGRARIARQNGGDLFVSLHCNASTRRAASGHEVYFLSEAKTAEAAAVAEMENAVLRFEENQDHDNGFEGELKGIASALFSNQFLKESQVLAADVRDAMGETFRSHADRGVKQANFYVMRGTMGAMPSVLIEMGFITNPEDEKRLRTRDHQRALARAILDGIARFKAVNERQFSDAP